MLSNFSCLAPSLKLPTSFIDFLTVPETESPALTIPPGSAHWPVSLRLMASTYTRTRAVCMCMHLYVHAAVHVHAHVHVHVMYMHTRVTHLEGSGERFVASHDRISRVIRTPLAQEPTPTQSGPPARVAWAPIVSKEDAAVILKGDPL